MSEPLNAELVAEVQRLREALAQAAKDADEADLGWWGTRLRAMRFPPTQSTPDGDR